MTLHYFALLTPTNSTVSFSHIVQLGQQVMYTPLGGFDGLTSNYTLDGKARANEFEFWLRIAKKEFVLSMEFVNNCHM